MGLALHALCSHRTANVPFTDGRRPSSAKEMLRLPLAPRRIEFIDSVGCDDGLDKDLIFWNRTGKEKATDKCHATVGSAKDWCETYGSDCQQRSQTR